MKICRIVSQLDFGGVEQRLKLTSNFFQDHPEDELIILVLGDGGKICKEINDKGFLVKVFNENVKIPNGKLIFKTYKFLRFHKPEVIHTSGAEANFHGLIGGFLARVPVRICEEIGFPNHGVIFRVLFKLVYSFSHCLIAISKAVGNCVVKLNEIDWDKISVIYNPVSIITPQNDFDIGKIRADLLKKSNKPYVFVTTCRLVPIKNLKFLINVFHNFVNSNEEFSLWIIGDGPERDELVELTHLYNITDKVVFFGFISNVIPLLKETDCFILPSFSEGFSISLVEAMLCGLPVISTNIGGPSEIINHGVNGFLFNPKDRIQLLKLMNHVSNLSKEELYKIQIKAVERGAEFSVENYGNNLINLYRALYLKC